MEVLNSLTTLLPTLGKVTGRITFSGGTPSVGSLTGTAIDDQAQVTISDTATGITTITVNNGLAAASIMSATSIIPVSAGYICAASNGTYSGNSGSVIIGTYAAATTVATDVDYTFTIEFY